MEVGSFIIPKDKDKLGAPLWWTVYQLLLTRYVYDGLDGDNMYIEHDSIERALMYSGMCAIFKSKGQNGKLVALPAILTELNIYGRPYKVCAYRFATAQNDIKIEPFTDNLIVGEDCAVIFNNAERVPTLSMVAPILKRLDKIWVESGRNLNMSRVMGMIAGNSSLSNQFKKAFEDMIEHGASVLPVGSSTATFMKELEKLDFNVEYIPDKYHYDFDETFKLLLTFLGINSVGVGEKKEHLITSEVEANNELLKLVGNTTKLYREWGLEQANKLFGTNIRIKEEKPNEQENPRTVGNNQGENRGDDEQ